MKNFLSKLFHTHRDVQLKRIADALERLVNIMEANDTKQTTSKLTNLKKMKSTSSNPPVSDAQSIIEYLQNRNIKVIQYHHPLTENEKKADAALDKLALFMGNNFDLIKDVYQRLKASLNNGSLITLNISHYPPQKISAVTQFLKNLKEKFSFLSLYNYKPSPTFQLTFQINRVSNALNFLSGGWFERYVKSVILNHLNKNGIPVQVLMNAKIVLPDGRDSELDIFLQIQDHFFWIETKTSSDHARLIERYSSLKRQLGIDDQHCALVILDISEQNARIQSGMYGLNLFNIRQINSKLINLIDSQIGFS